MRSSRRAAFGVGLALGLLALGGCDFLKCLLDLDCANVSLPGPVAHFTGPWTGTTGAVRIAGIPGPLRPLLLAFDGVYEVSSVALTLVLRQDADDRVTGTVTAGAVIDFEVAVTGRVLGSTLSLVGNKRFFQDTPAYDIQMTGEVVGNKSITGEYRVIEGAAVVKSGTWTAKKG